MHVVVVRRLVVAFVAQQAQVAVSQLGHVEGRAPAAVYSMMVMPLWFDAVQFQVIRGATVTALEAE